MVSTRTLLLRRKSNNNNNKQHDDAFVRLLAVQQQDGNNDLIEQHEQQNDGNNGRIGIRKNNYQSSRHEYRYRSSISKDTKPLNDHGASLVGSFSVSLDNKRSEVIQISSTNLLTSNFHPKDGNSDTITQILEKDTNNERRMLSNDNSVDTNTVIESELPESMNDYNNNNTLVGNDFIRFNRTNDSTYADLGLLSDSMITQNNDTTSNETNTDIYSDNNSNNTGVPSSYNAGNFPEASSPSSTTATTTYYRLTPIGYVLVTLVVVSVFSLIILIIFRLYRRRQLQIQFENGYTPRRKATKLRIQRRYETIEHWIVTKRVLEHDPDFCPKVVNNFAHHHNNHHHSNKKDCGNTDRKKNITTKEDNDDIKNEEMMSRDIIQETNILGNESNDETFHDNANENDIEQELSNMPKILGSTSNEPVISNVSTSDETNVLDTTMTTALSIDESFVTDEESPSKSKSGDNEQRNEPKVNKNDQKRLEHITSISNLPCHTTPTDDDDDDDDGDEEEVIIHEVDDDEERECPVCMSPLQVDDIVSWSANPLCSHVYHHECIKEWLLRHTECCLCKHTMLPVDEKRGKCAKQDALQELSTKYAAAASTSFYCVYEGLIRIPKTVRCTRKELKQLEYKIFSGTVPPSELATIRGRRQEPTITTTTTIPNNVDIITIEQETTTPSSEPVSSSTTTSAFEFVPEVSTISGNHHDGVHERSFILRDVPGESNRIEYNTDVPSMLVSSPPRSGNNRENRTDGFLSNHRQLRRDGSWESSKEEGFETVASSPIASTETESSTPTSTARSGTNSSPRTPTTNGIPIPVVHGAASCWLPTLGSSPSSRSSPYSRLSPRTSSSRYSIHSTSPSNLTTPSSYYGSSPPSSRSQQSPGEVSQSSAAVETFSEVESCSSSVVTIPLPPSFNHKYCNIENNGNGTTTSNRMLTCCNNDFTEYQNRRVPRPSPVIGNNSSIQNRTFQLPRAVMEEEGSTIGGSSTTTTSSDNELVLATNHLEKRNAIGDNRCLIIENNSKGNKQDANEEGVEVHVTVSLPIYEE